MDAYYKSYRDAIQRGRDTPPSESEDHELAARALRHRLDIPPHLAEYLARLGAETEELKARVEELERRLEQRG